MRKIIPYDLRLKVLAQQLRNNSTKSEIHLWKQPKGKQMMGFDFHRQKPIDHYFVDFFCYELMLGIEIDGITHASDEALIKDTIRENKLNALGISILRFNDRDILNDTTNVLRTIESYIQQWQISHQTHP